MARPRRSRSAGSRSRSSRGTCRGPGGIRRPRHWARQGTEMSITARHPGGETSPPGASPRAARTDRVRRPGCSAQQASCCSSCAAWRCSCSSRPPGPAAATDSSPSCARTDGRPPPRPRTAPIPIRTGVLQFIYGTTITSLIGMVIAVPVAVAVALYITEVGPAVAAQAAVVAHRPAGRHTVRHLRLLGDLRAHPGAQAGRQLPHGDARQRAGIGVAFAGPFFGVSYFTAGMILAIMVLPIVTALCREASPPRRPMRRRPRWRSG